MLSTDLRDGGVFRVLPTADHCCVLDEPPQHTVGMLQKKIIQRIIETALVPCALEEVLFPFQESSMENLLSINVSSFSFATTLGWVDLFCP